jgi:hypothetical protein
MPDLWVLNRIVYDEQRNLKFDKAVIKPTEHRAGGGASNE